MVTVHDLNAFNHFSCHVPFLFECYDYDDRTYNNSKTITYIHVRFVCLCIHTVRGVMLD